MNENVENLVLEHLRALRESTERLERRMDVLDAKMSRGFADVQDEMERMDGRIDGMILMLGNFATNITHLDGRIDRLDVRLEVLEGRDA